MEPVVLNEQSVVGVFSSGGLKGEAVALSISPHRQLEEILADGAWRALGFYQD